MLTLKRHTTQKAPAWFHIAGASLAVTIVMLSAYAWKKHSPEPAAHRPVTLYETTAEPGPASVEESKEKRPQKQIGALKATTATPPLQGTHRASMPESLAGERATPGVAKHHLKRLRTFIGNNDLDGFLFYLADHDMDLNTPMDTEYRTRLFELWFAFTPEVITVKRLRTLIDNGAILDPPDHNTLSTLLFSGNPDILSFVAENYPHLITSHGEETFISQACLSNPDIMRGLLKEGIQVSVDSFSEEELDGFEQVCNNPECYAILEETGIRFGERAVKNAITHGRFQALAHHAKNMDISELRIDGKNALDIALETPRTDVSIIRFLESQGLVIEPRHLQKAKQNLHFDGVLTLDVKSKAFYGSSSCDGFPFAEKVLIYMKKRLEAP